MIKVINLLFFFKKLKLILNYFIDQNFSSIFTSYKITRNLTNLRSSSLTSLKIQCDSEAYYIIIDSSKDIAYSYSKSLNLISTFTNLHNPFRVVFFYEKNIKQYIVSAWDGMWKFGNNQNQNIIDNQFIYTGHSFRGMYYNSSTNYIFVCSYWINGLFVFDTDLTLIRSIYFGNTVMHDIDEYNGCLYVSSFTGAVWVLKDEKVSQSFQTNCSSITALKIDRNGFIAVLCQNPSSMIYVYNSNGVYADLSFNGTILNDNVTFMDFDGNQTFVIVTTKTLYFLN